jgi:hypothetical protein
MTIVYFEEHHHPPPLARRIPLKIREELVKVIIEFDAAEATAR